MNALCNLSRKRSPEVAESLPGRFLSRRCFTLCITMVAGRRMAGLQARSKDQEILEEGGGAGPSLLPRRDHE